VKRKALDVGQGSSGRFPRAGDPRSVGASRRSAATWMMRVRGLSRSSFRHPIHRKVPRRVVRWIGPLAARASRESHGPKALRPRLVRRVPNQSGNGPCSKPNDSFLPDERGVRHGPRRRLSRGSRRAGPLDHLSRTRRAAASQPVIRGGATVSPASPRWGGYAGRIGVSRFRRLGACFQTCPERRCRAGNGRCRACLHGNGGRGPHRLKCAHRYGMTRADAKRRAAIVDARREDERPRPEIQPVGKGRQRQVMAVQHGGNLASACVSGGLAW